MKPSTFGFDKNNTKIPDLKSYLKDFYYVLSYYEIYPKNIIFCGMDVFNKSSLILTLYFCFNLIIG